MSEVIKHAVVYTGEDKIDDAYIRFDEQIEAIGPMSEYRVSPADQEVIDVEGKLIVPGFIDVHSHGGYNFDAMDGNAKELSEMVDDMVYEVSRLIFQRQ